jgi:hypothetical protein
MRSLKGIGATHLHAGRRQGLTRGAAALAAGLAAAAGAFPLTYQLFWGVINVTERYFVTGTDTEVGKPWPAARSAGGKSSGAKRGLQTGGLRQRHDRAGAAQQ